MNSSSYNLTSNDSSCAVLVVSCDAYCDIWSVFFDMFTKFWHDCPYPVYLQTNHHNPLYKGVTVLPIGEDISWSDNLLSALDRIPEDYVLLMLEDLILINHVQTNEVQKCVEFAKTVQAQYIRLNPSIPADKPYNDIVGIVSEGTIYRTSVVMSLFKKETLKQLLVTGENAWEFEYHGTQRSDIYDGFYATHYDYFPCVNAIIKGVWEYSAYQKLLALGGSIDTKKRRVMTIQERCVWQFKLLRTTVFGYVVPPLWKRAVKDWLVGKKPAM